MSKQILFAFSMTFQISISPARLSFKNKPKQSHRSTFFNFFEFAKVRITHSLFQLLYNVDLEKNYKIKVKKLI
jgi:hypothetical protein